MLCDPKKFSDKVDRLQKWYDLSDPRDLLTVTMQEMEVAEILALQPKYLDKGGSDKKEQVMSLIGEISKAQGVKKIDLLDVVSAYIDDMCRASNMDFAINKEQHL